MPHLVKVAHLVHWTKSGITSVVIDLARGTEDYLMLLGEDNGFDSRFENFRNRFCAQGSFVRYIARIKKEKGVVFHCHSFTPFLLARLFSRSAAGFIFHIHNDYPYFYSSSLKSKFKRLALKLLTKSGRVQVISVSTDASAQFELFAGKRCAVIPNGIRDVGELRSLFSEKSDSHRFISVCRLDDQKDLLYAINLMNVLVAKNPGLNLIYDIYGEGSQKALIQDSIERNNLKGRVRLRGYHSDPSTLYSQYDYYLSTSKYEGFGLSILSAMRAGLLIIMTKTGELVYFLEPEKNCTYIRKQSLLEDVIEIESLLNYPNFRKSARQLSAREVYCKYFRLDKAKESINKIYSNFEN